MIVLLNLFFLFYFYIKIENENENVKLGTKDIVALLRIYFNKIRKSIHVFI